MINTSHAQRRRLRCDSARPRSSTGSTHGSPRRWNALTRGWHLASRHRHGPGCTSTPITVLQQAGPKPHQARAPPTPLFSYFRSLIMFPLYQFVKYLYYMVPYCTASYRYSAKRMSYIYTSIIILNSLSTKVYAALSQPFYHLHDPRT